MISQDRVKELFDYKDGKLFWKIYKSSRAQIGDRAGCLSKDGYRRIRIDGKDYLEHRIIWSLHYGYFPKEIDHINRDPSDNRIENLREVSHSQNMMNRIIQSHSSKYKGVLWYEKIKKWRSQICLNGKNIYLGDFDSEKEDAEIYNHKAIELFGEYANINNIMAKRRK